MHAQTKLKRATARCRGSSDTEPTTQDLFGLIVFAMDTAEILRQSRFDAITSKLNWRCKPERSGTNHRPLLEIGTGIKNKNKACKNGKDLKVGYRRASCANRTMLCHVFSLR